MKRDEVAAWTAAAGVIAAIVSSGNLLTAAARWLDHRHAIPSNSSGHS